MDSIITNSNTLSSRMRSGCRYTFNELLKICGFTDTQLCFAILRLLKDGKIDQYRDGRVVYELTDA